jgi:multicomponent Na+:H+ antiporter subunit A
MSWQIPLLIALPALSAPLVLLLARRWAQGAGILAALVLGVVLVLLQGSQGAQWSLAWLPALGLDLSFRQDAWGGLFAVVAAGIGAPLLLYTGGYASDDPARGRLLAALLCFSSAMLGLVLADGLLTAFVFWEATSLLSWILVAHQGTESARAAARRALLVTGLGGLALLGGLVLMGIAGGSWHFSTMGALEDHPLAGAILILCLLGVTTKSALAPWQFWLPGAMAAPTPASAYLHAATMVKAGILLLGRLFPVIGEHPWWSSTLLTLGTLTIIVAAALMLRRRDLKAVLAGSTLATLAACALLAGVGSPASMAALPALVVAHALYKSGLFLTVGAIDHATHTRDLGPLAWFGASDARGGYRCRFSSAGGLRLFAGCGPEQSHAHGGDRRAATGSSRLVLGAGCIGCRSGFGCLAVFW